jgi:predicted acyltransferase
VRLNSVKVLLLEIAVLMDDCGMTDQSSVSASATSGRLLSLDVYRGLVMLFLCVEGPNWDWQGIVETGNPDSGFWHFVAHQTHHVTWAGCMIWDLIQPSFMFMVGVAMAYSYGKRERLGDSFAKMLGHACVRALVLILLGVFLRSTDSESTQWTFEDVVTQIGLGYVFLFLLWNRPFKVQAIATGAILMGYWALFALSPVVETAGNPEGYPIYEGFFAHWNLNANPAHSFDVWFLNLFPRDEAFLLHPEGYNTLNFVPSLGIMLMGLMAGEWLRKPEPEMSRRFGRLAMVGGICVAAGLALHFAHVCPLVKKTWTPAFTVFSGGCCLLILAALVWIVDVRKWQKWTFPFVVAGMNSVALYVMVWMLPDWINGTLKTHLSAGYAGFFGATYEGLMQNLICGVVLWLIALWMWRRKIFLRI